MSAAVMAPPLSQKHTAQELSTPVQLSLAGCHGGAGSSTFAHVLAAFPQLFTVRSDAVLFSEPLSTLAERVVLVASENAGGTYSAIRMLNAAEAIGVQPAAIILIADSVLPLPPVARQRAQLLRSRTPHVLHFPYLPQLRYSNDVSASPHELPVKQAEAVTRVVESLYTAINHTQ